MAGSQSVVRVPVPDLCCLWAETPTAPMTIALVAVFAPGRLLRPDGTVAIDEIRRHVLHRLPAIPALRRVLRPTRLGEGTPVWVDAPTLDIAAHVAVARPDRAVGTDEELFTWCAERSLLPLDRRRPLWRMDVVPGLADRSVGVLLVLHHVVADGLRGVELVSRLLDDRPGDPGDLDQPDQPYGPDGSEGPAPAAAAPPAIQPVPPPTARDLVRDNARRRVAALTTLDPARLRLALRQLGVLRREAGSRAPATFLTGPIGRHRQVAVVDAPVDVLRTAARARSATVNDLLVAAVTAGLRDLLLDRGECSDGLVLRASVPVGARAGPGAGAGAGAGGGMFIAQLPVGTPDPAERLRLITAVTRAGKQRPDAGIAGIVAMPALLARLGVAWAKRAATGHINLYVTNVPGPPTPLYLIGARLRRVAPLAPLVAGVRLSVTAMSYDGRLRVSLLGDEHLPDVAVLAAGVRGALAAFAAGGHAPRQSAE